MRGARNVLGAVAVALAWSAAAAQLPPPQLTQPVNDFARVIDPASTTTLDQRIRGLLDASGDVIVVATIDTVAPYADIREYAVKMFENRGKGIGGAKQDAGILVLLAVKDRNVRVEVGYGLEEYITDGFAAETSRSMTPYFRDGKYGEGLVAGVERIARRIEEARGIVPATRQPAEPRATRRSSESVIGSLIMLLIFIGLPMTLALLRSATRSRRRRPPWWGGGPWSGWNSGVGPFGGGGGNFGGGFGGFGGGMSGGGGGGASW